MSSALLIKDISDFEQLVRKHSAHLTQFAYVKIGNIPDAEDLVQELFINLWTKRDQIMVHGSTFNYLHVSLRNKIMNYFVKIRLHNDVLHKIPSSPCSRESVSMDKLIENDLNNMLAEILAQLPDNMQRIYSLRQEDFTLREIAEILGLAEQTVKGYSAAIKKRIKYSILEKHPELGKYIPILIYFLFAQ